VKDPAQVRVRLFGCRLHDGAEAVRQHRDMRRLCVRLNECPLSGRLIAGDDDESGGCDPPRPCFSRRRTRSRSRSVTGSPAASGDLDEKAP
jgi:hypothetical protein